MNHTSISALPKKPADMFDREFEWSALARFAADDQPGATLGVVSGRIRHGKSYLLDALCRKTGGFYFAAEEATDAESLRHFGARLAEFQGGIAPYQFSDWRQAMDALLALGNDRPIPVVIDEFPYLVKANPALPSTIQAAYGPRRDERVNSRTRLLLCGSAMSFMGKLLSGNAPLRGRAGLELVVPPLNHQLAAEFWGITDPGLALLVNSIVGGTPAYRREFSRNDSPADMADFDDWVVRTVLNPESPLFREARYLLAEEPMLRDAGLYHSVLAAVADGNTSRGGIANYLGRKAADIAHPLNVLLDSGLLIHQEDLFRSNRGSYRIAEPLITFYHAVMRPIWAQLERPGNAPKIWKNSQKRFVSNVVGPHFERICREWTLITGDTMLGAMPVNVGSGMVNDPARRMSHEIDVVSVGMIDDHRPPLLSIGEAKWNEVMGIKHLERLRHIKNLLDSHERYDTSETALVCYSGAGFTKELKAAEQKQQVVLVDLARIYQ